MPLSYEVIHGFFEPRSHTDVSNSNIDDADAYFTLVDKSRDGWTSLSGKLKELNDECGEDQCVKLIWIARHGEGYRSCCYDA